MNKKTPIGLGLVFLLVMLGQRLTEVTRQWPDNFEGYPLIVALLISIYAITKWIGKF